MSLLARLGVVLGLNSTEFTKGMDDATKKTREFEINQMRALKAAKKAQEETLGTFATALGGVAVAAALVGKAFQYADQIQDTADAFDVTVDSLLALKGAMQGAGGEADNITNALQKLADNQQAAKDGSDEMRAAFTKLGISGKDVENLKLQDMFKRVAQELSKVENATQRAALQQDILGKAMKGVDIRTFVDKYKEMGDPVLVGAIQTNAQAWDHIEGAFKSIYYFAQKLVLPLAAIVNEIAELADTIDHLDRGGSIAIDWGAAEGGGGANVGEAVTHGYGKPKREKPKPKPIALPGQQGDYSTQTDKQKSAAKRAADEAKRTAEARAALNIEIGLIQQKIKYGNEMFAVDMKGIVLGQKAIADEKSLVALNMDLATIQANAAKERSKEKAQKDLINKKEQEELLARVQQYANEFAFREANEKRLHELKMTAIKNESESIADIQTVQTYNALSMLELDEKQFELGTDAYELAKLRVEENNKLRDIHLQSNEALKQYATEYENSAKSARDLEIYEANVAKLREQTVRALDYTVLLEGKRQQNLKQQQEIQANIFRLDLAQQKGREINQIQVRTKAEMQLLELEADRYLMSDNRYNLEKLFIDNANALIAVEQKYNEQAREAYAEMERQGGNQKAREKYEQRIKMIEEIKNTEIKATEEVNAARARNAEQEIARQRSFTEGWEYASRKFAEDAQNAFSRGEAAFSSVMGNLDAAISNFVETGKFKFEDFTVGVIKDLLRIEMQAQATMLFRMLIGSFGGSFGSSIFPASASTPAPYGGYANAGVAFQTKATGGSLDGPAIVGENGPELFIPSQRGTVIPNTIAPSMAGMGQPQVVYNGPYIENMSAIDTQSAAQFLSKNKMSVWAANKSADRSVPVSR